MFWWIAAGFIAGHMAGMITMAVVTGGIDRFAEWRKRKNEQKDIRNYHERSADRDRDDDLFKH